MTDKISGLTLRMMAEALGSAKLIGYGGISYVFRTGKTTAAKVTQISATRLYDAATHAQVQVDYLADVTHGIVIDGTRVHHYQPSERQQLTHVVNDHEVLRQLQGIPGIPSVLGTEEVECRIMDGYFATVMHMDYLPGKSVDKLLKTDDGNQKLSLQEGYQIISEGASVLQRVHERRVVHMDIKPANMSYNRTAAPGKQSVNLFDFAIARFVSPHEFIVPIPAGRREFITRPEGEGFVQGTWCYLSPDSWEPTTINPARDIFAYGVSSYEILMGKMPSQTTDIKAFLRELAKYSNTQRDNLVDRMKEQSVPDSLAEAIGVSLDADPSQRLGGLELLAAGAQRARDRPVLQLSAPFETEVAQSIS